MHTLHSVIDDMVYIEDSNNNLGTLIIVGNMRISAYSTENSQLIWMKDDTIAGILLNYCLVQIDLNTKYPASMVQNLTYGGIH